jgi:hypothetical protein
MKNLKSFQLFEMNGKHFQFLSDLIDEIDVDQEKEILKKASKEIVDLMSDKTGISPEEIDLISKSISDWEFTDDNKITAKTTVFMPQKNVGNFKGIKFKKADKGFKIWGNKLTSMEGFPEYVGDDFDADLNDFKNLVGGPKIVKGSYSVSSNPLETLEGAPEEVGGFFSADGIQRIRSGEWDPEGWLESYTKSEDKGKSLLLTLPWFSEKGNAGKIYKEYPSYLADMWDSLPDDYKSRFVDESGENEEKIKETLSLLSKTKSKFI